MNVIICGAGEVGYNIARLLSDEKIKSQLLTMMKIE